jgi:hypothetical protein
LPYTYPVFVIGNQNSESLFYTQLTRKRRHISATMLAITWTERWLGDRSAEMDQSLGFLGRQI